MKANRIVAVLFLGALATTAWSKDDPAAGAQLYATNCAACHGANRVGVPGAFPALIDVGRRLESGQIKERIRKGGGLMPPFPQLSQQDIDDIARFLAQ